jgi:hypothetical protein
MEDRDYFRLHRLLLMGNYERARADAADINLRRGNESTSKPSNKALGHRISKRINSGEVPVIDAGSSDAKKKYPRFEKTRTGVIT